MRRTGANVQNASICVTANVAAYQPTRSLAFAILLKLTAECGETTIGKHDIIRADLLPMRLHLHIALARNAITGWKQYRYDVYDAFTKLRKRLALTSLSKHCRQHCVSNVALRRISNFLGMCLNEYPAYKGTKHVITGNVSGVLFGADWLGYPDQAPILVNLVQRKY